MLPCSRFRSPQPVPVPSDDQPAPPSSNEPLGTRFTPRTGAIVSVNTTSCSVTSTISTSATSSLPGSVNQICRRPVGPMSRAAWNSAVYRCQDGLTMNSLNSPPGSQPFVSWIATPTVRLASPTARMRQEN